MEVYRSVLSCMTGIFSSGVVGFLVFSVRGKCPFLLPFYYSSGEAFQCDTHAGHKTGIVA